MWQFISKSVVISSLPNSLGRGSSKAIDTNLIAQIQGHSHEAGLNESSRPVGINDPEPDFIHIGIGGGLLSGEETAAIEA